MTTFDLLEVTKFTTRLDTSMNQCDNGEGMQCATLDATLRHYAHICCEFREATRAWGRAVFSGQVAFDPEVENVLSEQGKLIYVRAQDLLAYSQGFEGPCYSLEGQQLLSSALWNLYGLIVPWVSPKLAVGPAARQKVASGVLSHVQDAMRVIDSLPTLPADWQPVDLKQRQKWSQMKHWHSSTSTQVSPRRP